MDYLYNLQLIREGAPEFINIVLLGISEFISVGGIFIACFVYWCLDKRSGAFILGSFSGGYMLNQVFKNTACVYRPWVSDPRLTLAPEASSSATGYSFPSGHTLSATTVYGGTGIYAHRHKIFVAFMSLMIVLTAFARNWLGAHTLKDVAFAIIEGLAVLIINVFIMKWLAKKDEEAARSAGNYSKERASLSTSFVNTRCGKERVILFAVFAALTIVALIYLDTKDYPVDYDDNGVMLADPYDMITDCFTGAGMFLGFLCGWILEKRFIGFSVEGTKKQKALRFILGFISLAAIYLGILPLVLGSLDEHTEHIIKYFVVFFYASGIYPALIKLVQSKRK